MRPRLFAFRLPTGVIHPFGLVVPDRLRAIVRASELSVAILAAVIGAAGGALVTGMSRLAGFLHQYLFGLSEGQRLSALSVLPWWPALLVPVAGGFFLAAIAYSLARWHPRRIVDPIEANALHGGQMSFRDSVIVAVQTLISNGFGASVGLEAGYTQIVAGLASRVGLDFRVRRRDLRVLVGCGAAAAIAAAFDAPLTGAFYGFELIIGSYTAATLAPVVTAAIVAVLVSRGLGDGNYEISVSMVGALRQIDLLGLVPLALICAAIAIAIMRGVTLVEMAFRWTGLPRYLHPPIGGVLLAGLAWFNPHVLSAGHGALSLTLASLAIAVVPTIVLIALKVIASSVALGSGFRGGLFFASLFLGALIGDAYAAGLATILPAQAANPLVAALVGMSATAVAIVGGPLTMAFLTLETTQDFPITLAVVGASVLSALTVRELFGYSFATWRMHIRGETIRSAHDVSWMRALTVGRLMRRDVRTVRADTKLTAFRRDFPLGSTQRVVAVDEAGRYAGIIGVSDAHVPELDAETATRSVAALLRHTGDMLTPAMNIKDAMAAFDDSESDALAVVDGRDTRNVLGVLTEAHALRRYSEELDRARRDLIGEAPDPSPAKPGQEQQRKR
jgi:CIC family chloride channel protein